MVDLEMEEARPTLLPVLDGDPRVAPLAHALGEAGWARASKATALVHGLNAVGTETARLLMTSGLAHVVLVDDSRVTPEDVVSQLLLADTDVGRVRSEAVAERLASANVGGSTTTRWQGCWGNGAFTSSYGVAGNGQTDASMKDGMGPGTTAATKVKAMSGTAVMFVEVAYRYQPIVSDEIFGPKIIRYTSAFNVRERTDQAIKNAGNLSAANTARCT